jgi:hypothetical protein
VTTATITFNNDVSATRHATYLDGIVIHPILLVPQAEFIVTGSTEGHRVGDEDEVLNGMIEMTS